MTPTIIYEDEALLVLNKPAGMPSVSLKENEKGTLAAWLIKKYPALAKLPQGTLEAGIVHRLDNDTTGCVVVAKTEDAYKNLRAQFQGEAVNKEYIAVVLGNVAGSGTIETPIAHHPRKKKKMMVCESADKARENKARPAYTRFELIKHLRLNSAFYSLVRVEIKTGVRHQIRAHMASIGHPLAGDALYMSPRQKGEDKIGAKRQLLHASKVRFVHPVTGQNMYCECPVPDDFIPTPQNPVLQDGDGVCIIIHR